MSEIAPCITVGTEQEYQAYIAKLQAFARRVHIDVSDGEFAPVPLLGPGQLSWPQGWVVDVHVMAKRPSEYVPTLIGLKPNLIILHAESDEDIMPMLQQIKQSGVKAGVALLKTTVPATVTPLIQAADHVMIFSGDLGHYGGEASLMQLEKVRLVKGINPKAEIGWDGGVSVENAYTLTRGGVNVLNSGGAIANANDPAAIFAELTKEANKRGVI